MTSQRALIPAMDVLVVSSVARNEYRAYARQMSMGSYHKVGQEHLVQ